MRYFLIGNNPRLSNDFIDSLDINDADIIILFNHHSPFKIEKIKNHPQKYLIMRKVYRIFLGQDEYLKNQTYFTKIFSFCIKNTNFNILKNITFLDTEYYNGLQKLNIKYPAYKLPSTGFVGFICYLNLITEYDSLFLIGFDGIYNGKLTNTTSHDFIFEQQIYKQFVNKNKIKCCNPSIYNFDEKTCNLIINKLKLQPINNRFITTIKQVEKPKEFIINIPLVINTNNKLNFKQQEINKNYKINNPKPKKKAIEVKNNTIEIKNNTIEVKNNTIEENKNYKINNPKPKKAIIDENNNSNEYKKNIVEIVYRPFKEEIIYSL